jgi:hypothetical protein
VSECGNSTCQLQHTQVCTPPPLLCRMQARNPANDIRNPSRPNSHSPSRTLEISSRDLQFFDSLEIRESSRWRMQGEQAKRRASKVGFLGRKAWFSWRVGARSASASRKLAMHVMELGPKACRLSKSLHTVNLLNRGLRTQDSGLRSDQGNHVISSPMSAPAMLHADMYKLEL